MAIVDYARLVIVGSAVTDAVCRGNFALDWIKLGAVGMPCFYVKGTHVTTEQVRAAQRVCDLLDARAGKWYLFAPVVIRVNESGPTQNHLERIEQLVVGPTGVFIIDVKSVSGRLRQAGSRWGGDGLLDFEVPTLRMQQLAKVVDGLLRERIEGYDRHHRCEARVLFTKKGLDLRDIAEMEQRLCFHLLGDSCRTRVRGLRALFRPIEWHSAPLTTALIEEVARVIQKYCATSSKTSINRIGSFKLTREEVGFETPNRASYRGVEMASERPALVRVYDLSSVPAKDILTAQSQMRAEYEALVSVGEHIRVSRILTDVQAVPGYANELYYFAVSIPRGCNLRSCLKKEGQDWDFGRRLRLALNLLDSVELVHGIRVPARGETCIVHRRLSPDVIFVSSDDTVAIGGWDVARTTQFTAYPGERGFDLTGYDAPEIATDMMQASPRSDIYALGAILYELFYGHLPFRNNPRWCSPNGIPEQLPRLDGDCVPSHVADSLHYLLDEMLAWDPAKRAQSLTAVTELLRELDTHAL